MNINEWGEDGIIHDDKGQAWAAYHADERELVGTEVLVSAMEVFDEETEANPFEQTFDPPRVGKVTYFDYRLLDDVDVWIVHPIVGVEVDGVEGWVDGRSHMWKVNNA